MSRIFVIDDDAAAELLLENLRHRGHSAQRIRSISEGMRRLEEIATGDLVILDLIMPHGDEAAPSESCRGNGMLIYTKLRERSKSLPIVVYTANQDQSIVDVIVADHCADYIPRWSGPSLAEFTGRVNRMLGAHFHSKEPGIFIVHGHDETAKYALKNYLQNVLHLPEPMILHEQPNGGRTLLEKFEDLARTADIVFVLLTPDDTAATGSELNLEKRRARQNVIFEMGYFLGHFGRLANKVFLLHKGELDLPSDISGLVYIAIDSGVEAAGEQIRLELEPHLRELNHHAR